MNCYERLEVDEVTPVQYLGVYVIHWRPEWGEPEFSFRESEVATELLEALAWAVEWVAPPVCDDYDTVGDFSLAMDEWIESLHAAHNLISKAKGEA